MTTHTSDLPGAPVTTPTSTAVARRIPDKIAYSRALASSGLLPAAYRDKPANLLWALEYAEMLGLHPMAAITGVFVIDGKPSSSAALISALVRRAGHKLRVTGDDTRAVAEIIRGDDPEFTFRSEWTLDRAKTAGLLGKGVWKTYPAAMLKARAVTEVARDACEDALSGLHYTAEELGATEVDEQGALVGEPDHRALVARTLASAPAERSGGDPDLDSPWTTYTPTDVLLGDVAAAVTVEELRALWGRQGEVEPGERDGYLAEVEAAVARLSRGGEPLVVDGDHEVTEPLWPETAQVGVDA